MEPYSTEDQQIEDIKKWWRENGLSIALGLGLGLSGVFGWRYWQSEKTESAQAASALYSDMMASVQSENDEATREGADAILADYENTAYGVFALLTLARLAVLEDDLDAATRHLDQALRQSGDASLSHVIRLRLIRVLISRNELKEARKLISGQEKDAFAAGYDELLGDIGMLQGDAGMAADAYQRAIDSARAAGRDVTALELKFNNIGQAP